MLVKNLPPKVILQFSIVPVLIVTVWSSLIVVGFHVFNFSWLAIPFLPISLLGIAVSFYVGFKNNASSERQNEARKNWGGITNDSRAFIAMLHTYLPENNADAAAIKQEIVKRHIAWLYAHKSFLRHKRMPWEHNLSANNAYRERLQQDFTINTDLEKDVENYITSAEFEEVSHAPNTASKLLLQQSAALKQLREKEYIEDFRLFELQNQLTKFYEHQGKNERIKTFPVPRQYANFANLFVFVFVLLLPLGLINEMIKMNVWLTIPFTVLIAWVFMQMEQIGDYSENPFEGLLLDIPITSIVRNIEIELLHSIGERDLPQAIQAKNGVLM